MPQKPAAVRDGLLPHRFDRVPNTNVCVCGYMRGNGIHTLPRVARDRLQPPIVIGVPLVQAGIAPDTNAARHLVSSILGWEWVDRIDEGIWNVRPAYYWPPNLDFDATLSDGSSEVLVTIDWP